MSETLRVERWSGRRTDGWRVVFEGDAEKARGRFEREAEKMRQGEVALIDTEGDVLERRWAPNLRTRW